MKIDYKTAAAFLKAPSCDIVLLYGPDQGLVSERGQLLGKSVTLDLSDPFRVSDLDAEPLRATPERLAEEAQALCLMGGRRLVRVRQATDMVRKALDILLELPAVEAFVIIEAGDLGPGSSLRKLAESHKRMAALPCYRDSEREAGQTLRALLAENGLRAEPDALAYLQQRLGADRGVTRREVEKLALMKTGDPSPLSLREAQDAAGDNAAIAMDDVTYAAFLGDGRRMTQALDRLLGEGEAPVAILRSVLRFLLDLIRLRGQHEAGAPLDKLLAARRPPLHFSVRDRYRAILARHERARLLAWLGALQAAEIGCKSTGLPDLLVCRQALGRIASEAALSPQRRS